MSKQTKYPEAQEAQAGKVLKLSCLMRNDLIH
jgi:hypothetical protein